MLIIIDKIQRKNPLRPDEPARWHVCSKSLGIIDEKEVTRRIVGRTVLNRKEAQMALFYYVK